MTDQLQVKRPIREVVAVEVEDVTEQSISDARQQMLKERRALEVLGIRFDPFRDGHVIRERRKRVEL